MPMSINLHQLAEIMRNVKRSSRPFYYVNKRDDKLYTVHNMPESSKQEIKGNTDIVPLPKQFDIREYGLMEVFARSLADRQTSKTLLRLMHSNAPFLKFREGVKVAGLKEEWYRFRHEIWYNAVSDWCQTNGISYEPKAPEVICRAADIEDANMITGLFLKLYYQVPAVMRANRADMYAKYTQLLATPGNGMFVAIKDNSAIGAAHCTITNAYEQGTSVGQIGQIQSIYVEPTYRSSYVLPLLITLCEEWAKAAGCLRTVYADAVKLFHDSSRFTCIITTKAPTVTEE
jgi:hypothetical protein